MSKIIFSKFVRCALNQVYRFRASRVLPLLRTHQESRPFLEYHHIPASMPKRWTGENSKATEARVRKEEQKRAENDRKTKEAEDAKWRETDSKVLRKQEKEREEQAKQEEKLRAKAAAKVQLQTEQQKIDKELQAKRPVKYTRAYISSTAPQAASTSPTVADGAGSSSSPTSVKSPKLDRKAEEEEDLPPLEENLNRTTAALREEGHIVETSVDGAIQALSGLKVVGSPKASAASLPGPDASEADRHPERRARAAYATFEERRLRELREEFPTARMSQLKEMMWKEWQKSPENPIYRATLQ